MKTLKELLKANDCKLPVGQHVYRIDDGKNTEYVLAESPAKAALARVTVTKPSMRDIIAANAEAATELAKEKAPNTAVTAK